VALTGEDFMVEDFAWSPNLPADTDWPAEPFALCEEPA
jgi:hypothetical protein